jgi:L-alanine-DL-glutamate epimerase-like enolase superfamily enzyme
MPGLKLSIDIETWALKTAFVIARGSKTEARVVTATITDGVSTGRGECVPYARYGETVDGVVAVLEGVQGDLGCIASRVALAAALPAGAARNALDCALWDLEAKRADVSAAVLAGLPSPLAPLETCYTLSLDTPAAMAAAARAVPDLKLLKLKLGGAGDDERLRAVRQARPDARLVADANEAWSVEMLAPFLAVAAEASFELIEQPLPSASDAALADIPHAVPICADESAHTSSDVATLARRYDAVNIKLDKTGGLTEALAMAKVARDAGLKIMVGSMVSTSLALAPAFLVAQGADWVDLDGPLLLAADRPNGFSIERGVIAPPASALWG